jgi:hypothetical protein
LHDRQSERIHVRLEPMVVTDSVWNRDTFGRGEVLVHIGPDDVASVELPDVRRPEAEDLDVTPIGHQELRAYHTT